MCDNFYLTNFILLLFIYLLLNFGNDNLKNICTRAAAGLIIFEWQSDLVSACIEQITVQKSILFMSTHPYRIAFVVLYHSA